MNTERESEREKRGREREEGKRVTYVEKAFPGLERRERVTEGETKRERKRVRERKRKKIGRSWRIQNCEGRG